MAETMPQKDWSDFAEGEVDKHGWRTIESAPKDGTVVLLCVPKAQPCAGMWFDRPGFDYGKCWLCFDPEGVFAGDDELDAYMASGWYNPTHWQPLPPPPENAE